MIRAVNEGSMVIPAKAEYGDIYAEHNDIDEKGGLFGAPFCGILDVFVCIIFYWVRVCARILCARRLFCEYFQYLSVF